MNFKPTWLKIIISLVIGFIVPILFGILTSSLTGLGNKIIFPTDFMGWLIILVVVFIIYGIWSLIQKKKQNLPIPKTQISSK